MRILSLGNCPLDPTLGSGKTRLARAAGLRALGHKVETLEPATLLTPTARRLGVRLGLAWAARRAIARVDLARYDLVEFLGEEFWWATRWLQGQPRRPLIVAHTDGLELLAHERLAQAGLESPGRLERWVPFFDLKRRSAQAFTRADRFVAVCQLDVAFVVKRGLFAPSHAVAIENGIDPKFLSRPFASERENTLVFFGSWTQRKGIAHLAPVIGQVLSQLPGWRFRVIGASGSEAAIRAAFESGLQSRIDVAPKLSVDEIFRQLGRAKILFFPSEYEGFGLATAEAMGCGCAAVVTPTGLGGDLAHGTDAWVCPFGDRRAMVDALLTLARDDARREALARAGRARVQTFTWERAIARIDATYQQWLDEKSPEA